MTLFFNLLHVWPSSMATKELLRAEMIPEGCWVVWNFVILLRRGAWLLVRAKFYRICVCKWCCFTRLCWEIISFIGRTIIILVHRIFSWLARILYHQLWLILHSFIAALQKSIAKLRSCAEQFLKHIDYLLVLVLDFLFCLGCAEINFLHFYLLFEWGAHFAHVMSLFMFRADLLRIFRSLRHSL